MKSNSYKCIFLGIGNAVINPMQNGPGFLLHWQDKLLLFDMGYGTMGELLTHNLSYKNLDALFLSHWHIDHISDLLPTLFIANIPSFQRDEPLPVFAPVGFKEVFSGLTDIFGHWIKSSFPISIIECHPNITLNWEGIDIHPCLMAHSAPTLGFRLKNEEKIFAYSGDTQKTNILENLFDNVDLGIIECSFPSNMSLPGHLNTLDLSEIFRKVPYGKLALYHLYSPARIENIQKELSDAGLKNIYIPEKGDTLLF